MDLWFGGKWICGLAVNGARKNNLLSPRISEHTKRAFRLRNVTFLWVIARFLGQLHGNFFSGSCYVSPPLTVH